MGYRQLLQIAVITIAMAMSEKLIPLVITKAINNQNIPIYGNGKNIRDWLYEEDM